MKYRKRHVLRFLKCCLPFCIFKIDGDIAKFVLNLFKNKNCLNISYLRQFLSYKKGRSLYENLVRHTASLFCFLCHE